MKKIFGKRTIITIFITILLVSTTSNVIVISKTGFDESDLDPLVDITITVEIKKIRSFEKFDIKHNVIEKIDRFSDPDFYVKVFINDVEFTSTVWHNTKYIYDPEWSATLNVPDDEEFVDIKIQLWDWNIGLDKLCDISGDYDGFIDSFDIELLYSIKTGNWMGDDFIHPETTRLDPSGYGRLNGCDDGSVYQRDRDCELWFDIYQNDIDGDRIPYWSEVNIYGTDPEVDNTGEDTDNDGIPIEWEHKWGQYFWYNWHDDIYEHEWFYLPFEWNDHANLDLDQDGIDNVEEYLTSQWGSDPFRKDLFIELDHMDESPKGKKSVMSERSKELLQTAYNRQNIVYHLDDGCMGGSDIIPFVEMVEYEDLQGFYWDYFLHGDENNWRRGVFHYSVIVYQIPNTANGFVFWGGVGPYLDSFVVSSTGLDERVRNPVFNKDIVYAGSYMHETGHTLGIFHGNTPGCDDQLGKYPWQPNYWKWRQYKSVMNYQYVYLMLDYSDGSNGKYDWDDWNRLDLTFFQRQML